jgi:signal transduction histidine kinase
MTNDPGNYLLRVGVVVVPHLIMFAGVWLLVGVLVKLPALYGALAMIPVAIAAGMFRGVIFAHLLYVAGLDPEPLISYRLFGGFASITLPMMITAVILQQVRDFQETRGRLLAETARLESALDEARSQLETDTTARSAAIRDTILGSLQRWQGTSAVEAAGTIQQTMDEIVRPLSHRLDSDELAWSPTDTAQQAAKVNWREALIGIFEPRNLHPPAIAITATAFGVNFLFQHQTPAEALYALGMILVLNWGCFAGLRRVLSLVSKRLDGAVPGVYLAGVLTTGAIVGLAVSPIRADTEEPFALLFYSLIFVSAFAGLYSIAASASEQAREANRRLAEATQEVAWETARVSEEIRQARQVMAKDLHGRVQAGFMSSLLKLQKAIEDGHADIHQLTTDTIDELEEIVSSIGVLDHTTPQSLVNTVDKVRDTWSGVATITLEATTMPLKDIERDPVVSRTLTDLVPELVFNAIRHGSATEVNLTMEVQSQGALAVTCTDNGTGPKKSPQSGLGTKLLDNCALTWSRSRQSQTTVTDLTLPFSPTPSNGS